MKRLRIGVLHGGRSGEHEVSIASAAAVFANIDRKRYEPVAIRIEKDGRWRLLDRPPSAASAAEVIEQLREAGSARGGRDVVMPARPAMTRFSSSIATRTEARRSRASASTSSSLSCTVPTAKTAPSRACWILPTCRMSVAACCPRPSAWTKPS